MNVFDIDLIKYLFKFIHHLIVFLQSEIKALFFGIENPPFGFWLRDPLWYSRDFCFDIQRFSFIPLRKTYRKSKCFSISIFFTYENNKIQNKSKYLDEFHLTQFQAIRYDFRFALYWKNNEIATFVYITPSPDEIVGSWRKRIFPDENERKEKKPKFWGGGSRK